MIDPLERWAPVRREARLRGPADVRRRALHAGSRRSWRGSTSRSSARRWTTSCPTVRARASRRARSAPPAARPGPHLEVKVDAFAALRIVDFGDAPVIPADPAVSHAAIEATVGAVLGGRRAAGRARRRPLDHQARGPGGRGGARPGRRDPLRHAHRHRRRGVRRRALARHVHEAADRRRPGRRRAATPRSACAATGRGRTEFSWQAEQGITACSRTTSATSASARSSPRDRRGRRRAGLPDRRRRRARSGLHPGGTGTPEPGGLTAIDLLLGVRLVATELELVGARRRRGHPHGRRYRPTSRRWWPSAWCARR